MPGALHIHRCIHFIPQIFTPSTWFSTLPHKVENRHFADCPSTSHNFHIVFHMQNGKLWMHTPQNIQPQLAFEPLFLHGPCYFMHTRFLNTVTVLTKEHLYVIFQNREKDSNKTGNPQNHRIIRLEIFRTFILGKCHFQIFCKFPQTPKINRYRSPSGGYIFRCALPGTVPPT